MFFKCAGHSCFLILYLLFSYFFISCGRFEPFSNKIDSTSDGSYVIETSASDRELFDKGLVVIYRFQSVPNLVAVQQSDIGSSKNSGAFSAPRLASLISSNTKKRSNFASNNANKVQADSCFSAYCEAGFDAAEDFITHNSIILNDIKIAVVDSGVIASTSAIKRILYSSSNITKDTNINDWLAHATMISSVFAGVMSSSGTNNIYAPNALLHSIKITFSGDTDSAVAQQYGSMQLAVALDKAVAAGAKIVNLSLTYNDKPDDNIAFAEQGIMAAAAQNGVFFVAAAGNDSVDIDANPVYPAAYNVNNLIVAGSHTFNLQKAASSNYGKLVDISAQGASISVNDKAGMVETVGGTSFAAPLVVSALAMYLGINQNSKLDVDRVLNDLFSSSNNYYSYTNGKQISNYGRLDVQNFIQAGVNQGQ